MGSIVVTNLGKAYKQYPTRWSRLREWLNPHSKPHHQLRWVLQNINFTVQPGEAVGIVGVNGAGKSTLLKMITGTTQPTTGSVHIEGRVAALLELGMGFHPDFSGRQNVYMAGQLQGYSTEQITALMPEIEAFADIGEYIDQPIRVYSSGMQMRLAFSVATMTRPEILIVDEALSVGDAAFQRKCFRRIESFRVDGTTLLFVSHSLETVKQLCNQAIFIYQGQIESCGTAKEVCDAYEQKLFGKFEKSERAAKEVISSEVLDSTLSNAKIEIQYGDGSADIDDVSLRDEINQIVNVMPEGKPFSVNYRVTFHKLSRGVHFGMMIKSVEGVCIYGTNTEGQAHQQVFQPYDKVNVRFELKGNLVPGTYYLNVGANSDGDSAREFMHRRVDTIIFRIVRAHVHVAGGYANMFAVSVLHVDAPSASRD